MKTKANLPVKFESIFPRDMQWSDLDRFEDRLVFHTREWLEFLRLTQKASPIITAIWLDSNLVGYFIGAIIVPFGLKILGSPFMGWSTSHLGFLLIPGIDRIQICKAFSEYAFRELKCDMFELIDRQLNSDFKVADNYRLTITNGYEIDLTQDEATLYNNLSNSSCRYSIRKSQRNGVTIENSSISGFADDYYNQLEDVYLRQGMKPGYNSDRARALIDSLDTSKNLLLLRARNSFGDCIATGIFPYLNKVMYFWGGASFSKYQNLCPNEPMIWTAIRIGKEKGMDYMDMGTDKESNVERSYQNDRKVVSDNLGDSKDELSYKRKYGSYNITYYRYIMAKSSLILSMRVKTASLYYKNRRLKREVTKKIVRFSRIFK